MRRFLIAVGRMAAAVALMAAMVAPATAQSRDPVIRTFSQDFERAGYEAVVFALNVGEIEVAGASTDTVTAEVRVRCSEDGNRERCKERAQDIELSSYDRHGKLYLEIEGTGLWRSRDATVHVILTVPDDMSTELDIGTGELTVENLAGDLTIEMSIGELTLNNVSGDLVVDMGIGEINVTMPQDAVGEVILDNGVGETELRHRDGRNAVEGILGGTDVHWNSGPGPHSVKIELNVGEIRVRLQ